MAIGESLEYKFYLSFYGTYSLTILISFTFPRTTKMDRIFELYQSKTGQIPLERTTDELSQLVSGQPHQVRIKTIPNLMIDMFLTPSYPDRASFWKYLLWNHHF